MEEEKTLDEQLIHAIVFRNDAQIVAALDEGADPNSRTTANDTGDAALHAAVRRIKSDVPRRLLLMGANPDVCNNAKLTPLYVAATTADIGHVETLLHHGADPLMTDGTGRSALHAGAGSRNRSVISALMRSGVPIEAVDENGQTAADVARARGHESSNDFNMVQAHLGASIVPADMPAQADNALWLDVGGDRGEFNVQNIGFWHNLHVAANALDAAGQGLQPEDKWLKDGGHLMDKAAHFFRIPDALQVLHEHDIHLQPEDMIKPDGQPYDYIKAMAQHGTLGQLFALPLWEGRDMDELRACQTTLAQHFPDEVEEQINNTRQLAWYVQRQSAALGQGR